MSSTQKPIGSTDNNQPTPTAQKSGMTRRDLLRRSAVGGGTLAGVLTGAIRLDHGPVQESEAIAPAVVAGAAGASAATGWALRELEIIGSDGVPEGLTKESLESEARSTARARESTNQSTILDNRNIAEFVEHPAYADGKIAAIDKLNEQASQSELVDAAIDEINDYHTTILKNLFNTWNEGVKEYRTLYEALEEHEETSPGSVFSANMESGEIVAGEELQKGETKSYEMPDGSDFDLEIWTVDWAIVEETARSEAGGTFEADPTDADSVRYSEGIALSYDGGNYLDSEAFGEIYDEINAVFSEVKDEITLWVDKVYSDVQSGELDTGELLSPREQAQLTSDDEDFPQAIADLQALNIGVDLEREAEIHIPDVEATLYGQLAYTGDKTLEVGEIDPDATDDDDEPLYLGTIYFNYDVSQGQGTWSAYDDGIDGGTLTLTSEPFAETIYYVDTAAGETTEFGTDDLIESDDGNEWTIDLSDQLDDQITEVDQIEYYADTESTQYETIQLQDPFKIIRFTDSDGNEYDETSFERSDPHSDDNYITEEEWQEQQERHEELIQKYEDSQGGGISIPGVDDVLDGETNGLIGIAVVGLVFVFGILSALNPLS